MFIYLIDTYIHINVSYNSKFRLAYTLACRENLIKYIRRETYTKLWLLTILMSIHGKCMNQYSRQGLKMRKVGGIEDMENYE